jgi:hypothetical protein
MATPSICKIELSGIIAYGVADGNPSARSRSGFARPAGDGIMASA